MTVGRDRVISTGAAAALLFGVRPLVWKSFSGLCGGVRERVVPLPRPGEYDVWRVVRQKLARISKSKAALVGAVAIAAAAVIGTTVGYASMGTSVTLNVDGHIEHVTATGDTVGQVLSDQGITLQSHDEVAPAIDQPVSDGTTIAVRYGKPLQLNVDGTTSTYWVTATDVRGALNEINRSFDRAHRGCGNHIRGGLGACQGCLEIEHVLEGRPVVADRAHGWARQHRREQGGEGCAHVARDLITMRRLCQSQTIGGKLFAVANMHCTWPGAALSFAASVRYLSRIIVVRSGRHPWP